MFNLVSVCIVQHLLHNHSLYVCKQIIIISTRSLTHTQKRHPRATKANQQHWLNWLFWPEEWVVKWRNLEGGSGGDMGQRGERQYCLKSTLKRFHLSFLGKSRTIIELDYGINYYHERISAQRPQDLHHHSWGVLHPWVCEFRLGLLSFCNLQLFSFFKSLAVSF